MPKRSRATLPWRARPEIVERALRVYKHYYGDRRTYEEIMVLEQIGFSTVWRDLCRARELADALAERSLESLRTEAVYQRRHAQGLALADRETAAPDDSQGRASLLRTVGDNQTAVEELAGLRKKEGGGAKASITLIQIGDKAPQAIADMTGAERALVKQHLLTTGGKHDEEDVGAEYTEVTDGGEEDREGEA